MACPGAPRPSRRRPAHPELRGVGSAETDVIVIPTGAHHPEEAWQFIKYVETQEVMEMLCLGQRKHSPLAHVSEAFYAQHPNPYIRLFAEMGQSPNAYAVPHTGVWREYAREMLSEVEKIQSLGVTPRDGLREVQEHMQGSLDRDNALYARRHP